MTDDKFYTSLSANNIKAKLTNHVQRTRLITPSTDKHYSLDSEDDFRSGCPNVSHQQQFFSELLSPGRSHNTNKYMYPHFSSNHSQHIFTGIIETETLRYSRLSKTRDDHNFIHKLFITLRRNALDYPDKLITENSFPWLPHYNHKKR